MVAVTQSASGSAASISGQGQPSVAPVLEFMCLFTHDLRRKQRRYQDGRLKFHTFNKRIMVYDDRGNFIGDSHWREDFDFAEGVDDIQLERGSAIVQVAECVGSTQQDLSELVDKRVQEKAQRQSAAAARHAGSSRAPSLSGTLQSSPAHFQQRHRPLQNMLGTPSGHYGRAVVPSESPYEQRRREMGDANQDSPRPAKRRREETLPINKQGYAQNLFGTALTLSAHPMSSAPVRHNPRKVLREPQDVSPPLSSDPKDMNVEDEGLKKLKRASTSKRSSVIPSMEGNAPEANFAPLIAKSMASNKSKGKTREEPITIDSVDCLEEAQETNYAVPGEKIDRWGTVASRANRDTLGLQRTRRKSVDCEPILDRTLPDFTQKSTAAHGASSRPLTNNRTSNVAATTLEPHRLDKTPGHSITELGKTKERDDAHASSKHYIELRIEPIKKRGLMMLADQGIKKKARKSTVVKIPTRALAGENENSDTEPTYHTSGKGSAPKSARTNDVHCNSDRRAAEPLPHADEHDDNPFATEESDGEHMTTRMKTANETATARPGPSRSRSSVTNEGDHSSSSGKAARRTKAVAVTVATRVPSPINKLPDSGLSKPPGHVLSDNLQSSGDENLEEQLDGSNQRIEGKSDPLSDTTTPNTRDTSPLSRDQPTLAEPFSHTNSRTERGIGKASNEASGKPHPTLAKLSRKSIRSREIIDFPSDDELDSFPSFRVNPTAEQDLEQQHAKLVTSAFDERVRGLQKDTDNTEPLQGPIQSLVNAGFVSNEYPQGGDLPTKQSNPSKQRELGEPSAPSGSEVLAKSISSDRHINQDGKTKSRHSPRPTSLAEDSLAKPRSEVAEGSAIQVNKPQKNSDAEQKPPDQSDIPEHPADCEQPAKQVVPNSRAMTKLANPATRGRKAARPSDAAGQAPESLLPSELRPIQTRPPVSAVKPVTETAREQPSALPGFSNANGGPWSREAYDLFSFTKPR